MPRRSSAMSSDSLSVPGTEMLMMCGARCARRGRGSTASGMRARIAASSRSRSARARATRASRSATASSAARARPTAVGDVLGAGPASAILRAAVQQRLDRRAAADEQRADSLRRADLVAGDREEVERRRFARRSSTLPNACTASVWKSAPRAFARRRELGDRLNRADLVVHPHHRADRRVVRHERVERARSSTTPSRVIARVAPRAPSLRRLVHRPEHRLVLDRRGHDRVAALVAPRAPGAEDGEVVGLGAAGGEADLVGGAPRHRRRARAPRRAPCAPRGPSGARSTGCRSAGRRTAASPRAPRREPASSRRGRDRWDRRRGSWTQFKAVTEAERDRSALEEFAP